MSAQRKRNRPLPLLFLVVLTACQTVGPDYERPEYPTPQSFRATPGLRNEDSEQPSLGELHRDLVFTDPVLQDLLRQAVANNYDVRRAAERVLEARALVTVAGAARTPEVRLRASPDLQAAVRPRGGGLDPNLFVDIRWEIDFWGRIARSSEAARAEVLGTQFARWAVAQTLVADLASAYFDLLELDLELDIARRTNQSWQRSYDLVAQQLEFGVVTRLELRQSEGFLLRSARTIPELEQLIEQQEYLIRLLAGAHPGPVPRGKSLLAQKHLTQLPLGLPTQLIERRPDVRFAEETLVAANARIGVAKAMLFPLVRLRFRGGLDVTGFLSSIIQPILNGGLLRSSKLAAESIERQATLQYFQTLQLAFYEVADALVACEKSAEVRRWTERVEEAQLSQAQLAQARFDGDATGLLDVLTSERDHLRSERELARAVRDELFAHVSLYRALGGGWQEEETDAAIL